MTAVTNTTPSNLLIVPLDPPVQPAGPLTAEELFLGNRGEDGRYLAYQRDPQHAIEHLRLHNALLAKTLRQQPDLDPRRLVINLKWGRVELDGVTVDTLDDPEQQQDLEALRALHDRVLHLKYRKTVGYSFHAGDYAPKEAPKALRNQTNIQLRSLDQFYRGERDAVILRNHPTTQARFTKAQDFIVRAKNALAARKAHLQQQQNLDAQSRLQNIAAAEAFDELPVLFAAVHPRTLQNLTDQKANIAILDEQKALALQFLKSQTAWYARHPSSEILESLATQLSLDSCCKTRAEYDFALAHFKVPPTRSSTERFLIQVALNNNGDIAQHFAYAFPEITHPEDRAAVLQSLTAQPKEKQP